MKKDSDGLDVRQRILDIYSKTGFDGIDAGDLRGRMRWMGLYTQRAQGIPGGKTALLEPEELEDSYFMMRVRIDGGQLSSDAAARDRRHQHRVRPRRRRRHRPAERAVPLDPHRGRARRSGGGSSRSGCRPPRPAATPRGSCSAARWPAILEDEVLDATDVLAATVAKYVGSPEFSNLPRKWKTSMSGLRRPLHRARDQRRLLRRRRERRRRGRLRPVGRRRAVDQPEVRPADRRLRPPRPGHRRVGGLHRRSSATTATAGSATTRG